MSSLDDRKNAYENKFAKDEESRFKIEARTAKLFGLWAAEQMGLNGDAAQGYASELVAFNLQEAGVADIKRKVRADFDAKDVKVSDHVLETTLEKCLQDAAAQLA